MDGSFAGSEVIEIGIQIEINGRDFYQKVAEKTKDQDAKKIFQYLAKEEEDHITVFQTLLNSVHKYEPKGAYPDEYFAYMNTLADGHVFTREFTGLMAAEKTTSDLDAVDLGIKFEEESIIFYKEMKKIAPVDDQTLLDQLIVQEKKHLQKLLAVKKGL